MTERIAGLFDLIAQIECPERQREERVNNVIKQSPDGTIWALSGADRFNDDHIEYRVMQFNRGETNGMEEELSGERSLGFYDLGETYESVAQNAQGGKFRVVQIDPIAKKIKGVYDERKDLLHLPKDYRTEEMENAVRIDNLVDLLSDEDRLKRMRAISSDRTIWAITKVQPDFDDEWMGETVELFNSQPLAVREPLMKQRGLEFNAAGPTYESVTKGTSMDSVRIIQLDPIAQKIMRVYDGTVEEFIEKVVYTAKGYN